jgi:hypothetical protein
MSISDVFRVIGRWYESMSFGHRGDSGSLAIYIIKLVQVKHHIAPTSIYIPGTFNHLNIIH